MEYTNNLTILVVQSGWVFLGEKVIDPSNTKSVVLNNASIIANFGTTDGLGQLALEGLQRDTVLNACGIVDAPNHAVLFSIPVTDSAAKTFVTK